MLQFGMFIIAFIGLVIELIKLRKNNYSQLLTE
ncbi:hypothetical protein HMPREF9985_00190 [Staphylococcus epidermidis NIHLM039]|nr:putative holin-like toxin [Staphylococcus epidermidis]EJE04278.1 hypothetical protein HMPREF9985_00190 [Staphylococcus epidermidis NIHLM039]